MSDRRPPRARSCRHLQRAVRQGKIRRKKKNHSAGTAGRGMESRQALATDFDPTCPEHLATIRPFLPAVCLELRELAGVSLASRLQLLSASLELRTEEARALQVRVRQVEVLELLRQAQQVDALRRQETDLLRRKAQLEERILQLRSQLEAVTASSSGSSGSNSSSEAVEGPATREGDNNNNNPPS